MSEAFAILFFLAGLILAGLAVLFYPTNVEDLSALAVGAYVSAKVLPYLVGSLVCFTAAIALGVWSAAGKLDDLLRFMRVNRAPQEPTIPVEDVPTGLMEDTVWRPRR